jgi:epsilon-lactone hydrolase
VSTWAAVPPPNPKLERLKEVLRERRTRPGTTIAEQRQEFEAAVAKMSLSRLIKIRSATVADLDAEYVEPLDPAPGRVILYLHGGGYVTGSPRTVRTITTQLAELSGVRVLAIDYPLAPESPYPAAIEGVLAAYKELLSHGYEAGRIVVGGDSAGAGLAVAALLSIVRANLPTPAGGLCLSPWFDLTLSGRSLDLNQGRDPQVQTWILEQNAQAYLGERSRREPLASPVFADLSELPPLLIQVGLSEMLLDDSRALTERAEAVGVDVTLACWPGMIHVWHSFAPGLPEARAAIGEAARWVEEIIGAG